MPQHHRSGIVERTMRAHHQFCRNSADDVYSFDDTKCLSKTCINRRFTDKRVNFADLFFCLIQLFLHAGFNSMSDKSQIHSLMFEDSSSLRMSFLLERANCTHQRVILLLPPESLRFQQFELIENIPFFHFI